MKKQIVDTSVYLSLWDLDGMTIAEAMTHLKDLAVKNLRTNIGDCKIYVDIRGDYDNNSSVRTYREETDEEYEIRLAAEEKTQQREQELYLKLKDKYEKI